MVPAFSVGRFEMPIRLLALDVDGTLLDSRGQVRPRVEARVRATVQSECTVVLATGRRLQSVEPIARRLGIRLVILVDGAVVYDLDRREAVFERTLAANDLTLGIAIARENALGPILFESPAAGGRVVAGPAEHDTPEMQTYLGRRAELARTAADALDRVERVVGMIAMGRQSAVARAGEAARAAARWSVCVWQPSPNGYQADTLSLSPRGTSKGAALNWLAERLAIPRQDTMAVGDYENDASMVAAAGLGVAMGNACPAVRAVAQAFVAANDDEGVAEAIERYVL